MGSLHLYTITIVFVLTLLACQSAAEEDNAVSGQDVMDSDNGMPPNSILPGFRDQDRDYPQDVRGTSNVHLGNGTCTHCHINGEDVSTDRFNPYE